MNNSNKDKGFFKFKGEFTPILCTFFIVLLMAILVIEVAIKPFVTTTLTSAQGQSQEQPNISRTITPYEDLMLYLSDLEKKPRLYEINMRKVDIPITYATQEKAADEVVKFYNEIYSREHTAQLQLQEKLIELKIQMVKDHMEQEKCVAPALNTDASSPAKPPAK